MKTKIFRSGGKDGRYYTIRIPTQLADKYSLYNTCEITDDEDVKGLIIKRVN